MSPLNERATRGTCYFLPNQWWAIRGTKGIFPCATLYEIWHIFPKNPRGSRWPAFVPYGAMSGPQDFSKNAELDFVNFISNLLISMNYGVRHSPVRRVWAFEKSNNSKHSFNMLMRMTLYSNKTYVFLIKSV